MRVEHRDGVGVGCVVQNGMLGDLAIVEGWLNAVNDADLDGVLALSAPDVEVVGPRGSGRGHALLGDWLTRAGFKAEPARWFCGEDGRVVVEHEATWTSPSGSPSRALLASAFVVRDRRVARYQRFDSTDAALSSIGLDPACEVRTRG